MAEARRRESDERQRARAQGARLLELRRKYEDLLQKHRRAVRQAARAVAERTSVAALSMFALRSTDRALSISDAEHVLFRNHRWHALERDRTPWRATARDPSAPAQAPTLLHLATDAAAALCARGAPPLASARYERPERGDAFDVRFEVLPDRRTIGVSVQDVTRQLAADRALLRAERDLAERASPDPAGGPSEAGANLGAPLSPHR